jgi:hypothetical protein
VASTGPNVGTVRKIGGSAVRKRPRLGLFLRSKLSPVTKLCCWLKLRNGLVPGSSAWVRFCPGTRPGWVRS